MNTFCEYDRDVPLLFLVCEGREEVIRMKKRKVVKRAKTIRTKSRRVQGEKKLIYGLEQEFVLIFGGGSALVLLGVFILFLK